MLEDFNCTYTNYTLDQKDCSSDITASLSVSAENAVNTIANYRDFKEYTYYRNVISILPYAPNIPGIVTNTLTIITAVNMKPLRTSEIYMVALGSADLITVLTRCVYIMWSINNNAETVVSCKLPRYIVHLGLIFSNITLMSWTIERFIAVIFPIKLATLLFLLLLSFLLGIPLLNENHTYSFKNGKETVTVCFATHFLRSVWSYIESFYYIYIPMVCVSACNVAILCRLNTTAKSRMNMTINLEAIDKSAKENRRMTTLLLSISGCFIFLHIPFAINLVFNYIYPDPSILIFEDPHFFARFLFYSSLGFLITEYQNSINFFLYCISGKKFRATFRKIICKTFMKTKRTKGKSSSETRSSKF